jgi:hypothetical protein
MFSLHRQETDRASQRSTTGARKGFCQTAHDSENMNPQLMLSSVSNSRIHSFLLRQCLQYYH